ncbi:MAG: glycoside hydrolase family 2 TIM barrel-domain containing protein, partial [Bryobacteraceae bacterium]
MFRIENPPNKIDASPDKQQPLLPTGMLNYIANWGGFYGGVYLESTDRTWIESTRISSHVAKRLLTVAVQLETTGPKSAPVTVRVSAHGTSKSSEPIELTTGKVQEATVQLEMPYAPLWSPEHPSLITASVEILRDAKRIDRKEERFGFRTITTRGNRLLLNGQPIYLRGYGDDNVEVLTGFPPASRAVYVQRLSLAKSFGFNAIRYHSMVPPQELFEAADEVGMLIMAELPAAYTQYFFAHQDYLRNELQRVLLAYRNHPSLLSLAFGNEFNLHWLKSDEDRRTFVDAIAQFYALAKQLAPSTLILSNDGFDLRPTDMVSLPGGAAPDRPTIRHEFGDYYCSLPDIGLIDKFTGVLVPDWLNAKQAWVVKNSLQDVYSEYLRNSTRLQ